MNNTQKLLNGPVTDEVLKDHHCLEKVDRVSNDTETTTFKRTARLLQSLWREEKGLPIGSQPMLSRDDKPVRPLGSRINLETARETGANFLSENVRSAVKKRLDSPQSHQTLDENRLYCDLLSSMPRCFNLFGELAVDTALADKAVHTWWPDTPGTVIEVKFEWSPGRSQKGQYLENRSAFDVAFILDLGNGKKGVIGVETKYHEHAVTMTPTSDSRMEGYKTVGKQSGVFTEGALEEIIGTELQQIWLDHLLALSMLQHPSGEWEWTKFVLVHPSRNPSFARLSTQYQKILKNQATFGVSTVEELLDAGVLPAELTTKFRERYLW
jgi:hypothetical protein